MSDNLGRDLDLYLQNLKKESKKPSWIGVGLMVFIAGLFFIGFLAFKGVIGVLMLLISFFIVLMIIGSYMVK